jgi:hypothetical protein
MITVGCAIFGAGSFFGSKVIEVTPPSFTKAVGIILGGWADDPTLRIIAAERLGAGQASGGVARIKEGSSIAVVVTGPPDTTFTWSGFGSTGTTATDSTGRCVFPNLIVPPAYTAPPNRFSGSSSRSYQEYPLQVNWPDGAVSTFLILALPAD